MPFPPVRAPARGVAPPAPPVDLYFSSMNGLQRISADTEVVTPISGGGSAGAMAVDALGNIYLAATADIGIEKLPAGGGASSRLAPTLQTGGVAVDDAGNVYGLGNTAADDHTFQAVKIDPSGGAPTVLWSAKYPENGQLPWSVDVDLDGNVYLLLFTPATVVRIPADGGPQTVVNLGGIFSSETPWAFAVDPQGQHVYLGDIESEQVVKVPLAGGPYTRLGTGPLQTWGIHGIAVDAAGNAYICDTLRDRVVMVRADSSRQVTILNTPQPQAIAVQLTQIQLRRPPDLIGRLIGEVVADGGGWIVIGNRFIPIPPRSPGVPMIARAATPYLGHAIEDAQLGDQLRQLKHQQSKLH